MQSSNETVATISDDGFVHVEYSTVKGNRSSHIFVANPSQPDSTHIGSTLLSISANDDFVSPVAVEVYVIASVEVIPISSPFINLKLEPVVIRQTIELNDIDQVAEVATVAVFNDGSRMALAKVDGVVLDSDETTLKVLADRSAVMASGSGIGNLVSAVWQPAGCSGGFALAAGHAFAKVTVPDPIRVELVPNSAGPFTVAGDPLYSMGAATVLTIKVYLVYPTANSITLYKKDVTQDADTIIELAGTAGVMKNFPALNPALFVMQSHGKAVINVKFRNLLTLKTSLIVDVAQTKSVRVKLHPFPEYPMDYVDSGPKSIDFDLRSLHRYSNPSVADDNANATVWQQAIPYIYAVGFDDALFALPSTENVTYRLQVAGADGMMNKMLTLDGKSRVISVNNREANALAVAGTPGLFEVTAHFGAGSQVIDPAPLILSANKVQILTLENLRVAEKRMDHRTVVDFKAAYGTEQQLIMGARFSDGTHLPELFPVDTASGLHFPLFPGLIGLYSDAPAVIGTDNVGGRVILFGNGVELVVVDVNVTGQPDAEGVSIGMLGNLDPLSGDVDIGSVTSVPMGSRTFGEEFEVPIRINTGNQSLGAFDLEVTYDPAQLQVAQMSNGAFGIGGSDWPGGIFEATVDPPGVLKLGGVPVASARLSGPAIEIAVVRVKMKQRGVARISGVVNTMSAVTTVSDLIGARIGSETPRKFVAGTVNILVPTEGRQRRQGLLRRGRSLVNSTNTGLSENKTGNEDITSGSENDQDSDGTTTSATAGVITPTISAPISVVTTTSRAVECVSPPCAECTFGQHLGDANGDCNFDIRDVAFLQTFLVERIYGFVSDLGKKMDSSMMSSQKTVMDVNLDGRIDASDARYLARVNFGILRFVTDVRIRPVQNMWSGGLLTINATTYSKGNVIQSSDLTSLYLDLSYHLPTSAADFAAARSNIGTKLNLERGEGLYGAFFKMLRIGPVFDYGKSALQPAACKDESNTLDVCSGIASEDALFWYFDSAAGSGECKQIDFSKCTKTRNFFTAYHECTSTCLAQYVHSVQINTSLVGNDIGASFVMIAYDSLGDLTPGRDTFLTAGSRPYLYTSPLHVDLELRGGKTVAVVASDGYNPLVKFNNTIASIDAINEYNPVFTSSEWNATLSEASAVGIAIGPLTLSSTDADDTFGNGFRHSYRFKHDTAYDETPRVSRWGPLALDIRSGVVTLVDALDYETTAIHEVEVEVSDNTPPRPRFASANMTVYVTDVNDNTPTFSQQVQHTAMGLNTNGGSFITQLLAYDRDSGANSRLQWQGGFQSGNFSFQVSPDGTIATGTRGIQLKTPTVYTFPVNVSDGGDPPRAASSLVIVTALGESNLFHLILAEEVGRFARRVNPITGGNPCLEALEHIFLGKVVAHELIPATKEQEGIDLLELTVYVIDNETNAVRSAKELNAEFESKISDPLLRAECLIFDFEPVRSAMLTSQLKFYADASCSEPFANEEEDTWDGNLRATPGDCVRSGLGPRSGRVFCKASGVSPDEVRVYENTECNSPDVLKIASSFNPNATIARSPLGGVCTRLAPFGFPDKTVFFRAYCGDNAMAPCIPPECGSGYTEEAEDAGLAESAIAGIAAGCALSMILIFGIVYKVKADKQKKEQALLLVMASQGDVVFGAPVPMHGKGGPFSGGEIDPVTGEMVLYKNQGLDAAVELDPELALGAGTVRLPNMWGGQRANPLLMGALGTALGIADDDGDTSDEDADADSLGNLSDFEDADFEAFADSLLDDHLDDELFGFNKRNSISGDFRNPPLAQLDNDSLSDFENAEDGDDVVDALGMPLSPVVGYQASRPNSTMGKAMKVGGSVEVAHRQMSGDARARRYSVDSVDLDEEIVVMSTTYENVGQAWQTQINTAPHMFLGLTNDTPARVGVVDEAEEDLESTSF
jgi:hypothetical protein